MKDGADSLDPLPKKSGKKGRKTKLVSPDIPDISKMGLSPSPTDEDTKQAIANIIQNSVEKYTKAADDQLKQTRSDFDNLQPIISEFLDEFIVIGHTLDGQRVVMRYTPTPADDDKLTELCKKVLVRMLIKEQQGE